MSTAADEAKIEQKKADDARAALVSDIQELRKAGDRVVAKVGSRLPWVIGGAAAGLLLFGVAVAVAKSRRRPAFGAGAPGWLQQATRAAGIAAVSILARRLTERAISTEPLSAHVADQAGAPVS